VSTGNKQQNFLIYQGKAYLRYLRQAGNAHRLHSPFLFDLYQAINRAAKQSQVQWHERITAQRDLYVFWTNIEAERQRLRKSPGVITVTDFGAGSTISPSSERSLRSIASGGILTADWCRRLAALRYRLPAGPALELGTSLGITTAYLASVSDLPIITVEGCPATLGEAKRVWHQLGVGRKIIPVEGNLDQVLDTATAHGPFALIIIDANHRSGPVQHYFDTLAAHLLPGGCIVLDDIYWTPDMTQAWEAIKARPFVRQSIDMYQQGWLFAREEQAPQHVILRA